MSPLLFTTSNKPMEPEEESDGPHMQALIDA